MVNIKINGDNTVSGSIGMAEFENGKIKKNFTLWDTGITYVIECDTIGKIFPDDPVESKVVEIWLGSLNSNGTIKAELRLGAGSVFPMADLLLKKGSHIIE